MKVHPFVASVLTLVTIAVGVLTYLGIAVALLADHVGTHLFALLAATVLIVSLLHTRDVLVRIDYRKFNLAGALALFMLIPAFGFSIASIYNAGEYFFIRGETSFNMRKPGAARRYVRKNEDKITASLQKLNQDIATVTSKSKAVEHTYADFVKVVTRTDDPQMQAAWKTYADSVKAAADVLPAYAEDTSSAHRTLLSIEENWRQGGGDDEQPSGLLVFLIALIAPAIPLAYSFMVQPFRHWHGDPSPHLETEST